MADDGDAFWREFFDDSDSDEDTFEGFVATDIDGDEIFLNPMLTFQHQPFRYWIHLRILGYRDSTNELVF